MKKCAFSLERHFYYCDVHYYVIWSAPRDILQYLAPPHAY